MQCWRRRRVVTGRDGRRWGHLGVTGWHWPEFLLGKCKCETKKKNILAKDGGVASEGLDGRGSTPWSMQSTASRRMAPQTLALALFLE